MKKPPAYWFKAKKILSGRDPVIRKIIKKYKKGFLATKNKPFFSLCRTIVGQQVSVASADSIWSKFAKKCKKKIRPKVVLRTSSRVLKSAGLSRQKVSYLNKFGVDLKDAPIFFSKAAAFSNVSLKSLAVHIGSQLTELSPYRKAYGKVAEMTLHLRTSGRV